MLMEFDRKSFFNFAGIQKGNSHLIEKLNGFINWSHSVKNDNVMPITRRMHAIYLEYRCETIIG